MHAIRLRSRMSDGKVGAESGAQPRQEQRARDRSAQRRPQRRAVAGIMQAGADRAEQMFRRQVLRGDVRLSPPQERGDDQQVARRVDQERQTGSTAVFSGMLGVIVFGLCLTPVFCVALRAPFARKPEMATAAETGTGEA